MKVGVSVLFRIFFLMMLIFPVGCGWLLGDKGVFRDKSSDYRTSPEFDEMEIPVGKSNLEFLEIYPVPELGDGSILTDDFDVPRPSPITANTGEDVVRIQRLAEEQWALVEQSPGKLWPKVRAFLRQANLPLGRIDARQGIIETNWLQLKDQDLQSRFQFRIDRGVQRESSELHILQMNQSEKIIWPEKSDDLSQETQMLRDIAQFIANSEETDSVSMIADRSISSSGRINMKENSKGEFFLSLNLPFNRSWASVERALAKSFFEITDKDRSQGIYFATYVGPKNEDKGWFDWLWGRDDQNPLAGKKFLISVQSESDEQVNISIHGVEEDSQLDKGQEQVLLSLLKANIS